MIHITEEQIRRALDYYEGEVSDFCSMDYKPAPSGEYISYNHGILVREEVVQALSYLMDIIGINYLEVDEKYFEFNNG